MGHDPPQRGGARSAARGEGMEGERAAKRARGSRDLGCADQRAEGEEASVRAPDAAATDAATAASAEAVPEVAAEVMCAMAAADAVGASGNGSGVSAATQQQQQTVQRQQQQQAKAKAVEVTVDKAPPLAPGRLDQTRLKSVVKLFVVSPNKRKDEGAGAGAMLPRVQAGAAYTRALQAQQPRV